MGIPQDLAGLLRAHLLLKGGGSKTSSTSLIIRARVRLRESSSSIQNCLLAPTIHPPFPTSKSVELVSELNNKLN